MVPAGELYAGERIPAEQVDLGDFAREKAGKDYVKAVRTQLAARSSDYRKACRLLKNSIEDYKKPKQAWFLSNENKVTIAMTCAKKNPRGIGSIILHEHGHALDYAIGVKLGHGREISEVIGLGKSIRSELKANLFKEAEDYFKTHPELAKDFYDDDQRLSAYAYEKFSGETLPTKSHLFSYPKLPDVKHLIFDKRNDHDREPLSDMISGATINGSNLGYFHTESYWSLRSEGWEGFTEIGTLSESQFGIKFLETYLPQSYALWKKAIRDGADAADQ